IKIDSSRRFFDGVQICADSLSLFIALTGDLFMVRKNTRGFAKVYKNISALHALHGAIYDLTLFFAVLLQDRNFFSFSDPLDDDLFCRLRGDSTVFVA